MRVLVLNADATPLTTTTVERAIRLAYIDKSVTVLEEYPQTLRSPSIELFIPAVVILRKYVKRPHKHLAPTRTAIFARDDNECQYCGAVAENIDHIVPRSKGGKHMWTNVVAACIKCNSKKSDKLLADTQLRLRSVPAEPKVHHRFTKAAVPEWESYLGAQ